MATWQADFSICPYGTWPADLRERLDRIVPRGRSWTPTIATWGAEDGNRIDVYLEGAEPQDGLLRVDLRAWDPAFVTGVLDLLRELGFGLEDPAGNYVEPTLGELAIALRRSPAFRFVEDPERFFRRLQLGGLDDA